MTYTWQGEGEYKERGIEGNQTEMEGVGVSEEGSEVSGGSSEISKQKG